MFKTIKIKEEPKKGSKFTYVTAYDVTSFHEKLLKLPTAQIGAGLTIIFIMVSMISSEWMAGKNDKGQYYRSGLFSGCLYQQGSSKCISRKVFNGGNFGSAIFFSFWLSGIKTGLFLGITLFLISFPLNIAFFTNKMFQYICSGVYILSGFIFFFTFLAYNSRVRKYHYYLGYGAISLCMAAIFAFASSFLIIYEKDYTGFITRTFEELVEKLEINKENKEKKPSGLKKAFNDIDFF